jgi:hypothetical protein
VKNHRTNRDGLKLMPVVQLSDRGSPKIQP